MSPDANPPAPALSRRGLYLAGISALLVGVVIVVFGITTRKVADAKLQEWTEAQAIPVVAVAPPDTRGKTTIFSLPGRLEAYIQAQIYARVTGYVKKWDADIGTPVKAGQLLAELDAPDVDQQIMQAEANLASAKANSILADATLKRGQSPDHELCHLAAGSRSARGGRVQQTRPGARRAGQPRPPARARTI